MAELVILVLLLVALDKVIENIKNNRPTADQSKVERLFYNLLLFFRLTAFNSLPCIIIVYYISKVNIVCI